MLVASIAWPAAVYAAPAVTFTTDFAQFSRDPPGGHLSELGAITSATADGGSRLVLAGHFGTSAAAVPFDIYSQAYNRGQTFQWGGMMDGTIIPGDNFSVTYDLNISSTGGTVYWYMTFLALDGEDPGPGIPYPYFAQTERFGEVTGTQRVQGVLAAPFDGPGPAHDWEVDFDIDWFDAKPGDTMYVDIPATSSFDVEVAPVPEPASFAFIAAAVPGLLIQSRKRAQGQAR